MADVEEPGEKVLERAVKDSDVLWVFQLPLVMNTRWRFHN